MDDKLEIPFELPLDEHGYLRRQCPRCERLFKWHPDPVDDNREIESPVVYYCPYCGEPSPVDQWWTNEQVDHAQALAANEAMKLVEKHLRPSVDKVNRSGGMLRMDLDVPHGNPPAPLFEPDDMVAVEPPCHPEEPVKIIEDWDRLVHCLVCGKPFTVRAD